jgi:FKBP-type peptidyl-prolyl cis-trans isomerase
VRLHYSIHMPDASGRPGAMLYDSCQSQAVGGADAAPMQVPTGEGQLPEGVEMALKLMLPGEACEVYLQSPDFGYASCAVDPPAGVPADQPLVFRVEMVDFVKEGHPQTMTADQVRRSRGAARSSPAAICICRPCAGETA